MRRTGLSGVLVPICAAIRCTVFASVNPTFRLNSEVGGELFYNFGISPAWHVTFDLQAVSSARPRQETALILSGRVAVNF